MQILLTEKFNRVAPIWQYAKTVFRNTLDKVIDASGGYHSLRMKNGVGATINKIPESNVLTMGVNINAGFNDDQDHKSGTSHLLEHMVFVQNSAVYKQFQDEYYRRGGRISATTHSNNTSYT